MYSGAKNRFLTLLLWMLLDIVFIVCKLSKYNNPSVDRWKLINRILSYLKMFLTNKIPTLVKSTLIDTAVSFLISLILLITWRC